MTEIGEQAKAAASGPAGKGGEKEKAPDWFDIELVDGEGNPVKGAAFEVELRDGGKRSEKLDSQGKARVEKVKPGAHRVSFPDLPDDHWIGTGEAKGKKPKQVVVMTGQKATIRMVPRIECGFRCLKIVSQNLTTGVVPIRFCGVYLFYEVRDKDGKKVLRRDRLTFTKDEEPRAELGTDGKCGRRLVQGATYHCYFAGKELSQAEIDALMGEKRRLLVPVKAAHDIVIQQSFCFWIALLHHVEAVFAAPADVLTKVRKLHYDDSNWNRLIDRESMPPLYDYDERGVITNNAGIDLDLVYALGRTYVMRGDRFEMAATTSWERAQRKVGLVDKAKRFWITDRHDLVILPDRKSIQMGHVLTGIEACLFEPSTLGGHYFDYPRTAATWAGDLGQAVHTAVTYGANAADWEKARQEKASSVEIFGDVHGDVLGREWTSRAGGGKKLSEVLEWYFTDPERDQLALKSFLASYAVSRGALQSRWDAAHPLAGPATAPAAPGGSAAVQSPSSSDGLAGLRDQIVDFAEAWDTNKQGDFKATTHAPLVEMALTCLAGELLALDPSGK